MSRRQVLRRPLTLAGALAASALGFSACGELPLEPITLGKLEAGEFVVLRGASAVRDIRLTPGGGSTDYLVVIQNGARTPGSLALRFAVGAPEGLGRMATSEAAARATDVRATDAGATDAGATARPSAQGGRVEQSSRRHELERRMRAALRRAGARPYVGTSSRVARAAAAIAAARETLVGDTLSLRSAVRSDLSVDCGDTTRILQAIVRLVGEHFLLALDTEVEGGFLPFEWEDLGARMDAVIFPVDTAYFGPPADLDGNGRILVLFTPEVNRLSPRGSETFVGGFFWPGDLADRSSCPVSNRGEILYLLAPDAAGRFGDRVPSSLAERNALEVSAHELAHLLGAQQRVSVGSGRFDDLEELWLSEGMAHVAEEVVGLRAAGLGTRANLTWTAGDPDSFGIWVQSNFTRLAHHLAAPHRTQGLAGDEPSGLASLAMRGNAWIFLRWLGDRYGPEGQGGVLAGSEEERLFRDLSGGGAAHAVGIANVERAVAALGTPAAWEELLSGYGLVLALDDVEGAPVETALDTWNLREVFRTLAELVEGDPFSSPYPLASTRVTLGAGSSAAFDLDVSAFGARYFRLEVTGAFPNLRLQLTAPGSEPLRSSTAPVVTIGRLR